MNFVKSSVSNRNSIALGATRMRKRRHKFDARPTHFRLENARPSNENSPFHRLR